MPTLDELNEEDRRRLEATRPARIRTLRGTQPGDVLATPETPPEAAPPLPADQARTFRLPGAQGDTSRLPGLTAPTVPMGDIPTANYQTTPATAPLPLTPELLPRPEPRPPGPELSTVPSRASLEGLERTMRAAGTPLGQVPEPGPVPSEPVAKRPPLELAGLAARMLGEGPAIPTGPRFPLGAVGPPLPPQKPEGPDKIELPSGRSVPLSKRLPGEAVDPNERKNLEAMAAVDEAWKAVGGRPGPGIPPGYRPQSPKQLYSEFQDYLKARGMQDFGDWAWAQHARGVAPNYHNYLAGQQNAAWDEFLQLKGLNRAEANVPLEMAKLATKEKVAEKSLQFQRETHAEEKSPGAMARRFFEAQMAKEPNLSQAEMQRRRLNFMEALAAQPDLTTGKGTGAAPPLPTTTPAAPIVGPEELLQKLGPEGTRATEFLGFKDEAKAVPKLLPIEALTLLEKKYPGFTEKHGATLAQALLGLYGRPALESATRPGLPMRVLQNLLGMRTDVPLAEQYGVESPEDASRNRLRVLLGQQPFQRAPGSWSEKFAIQPPW